MMAKRTTSSQNGFAESMITAKLKLEKLNLEDESQSTESSTPDEPLSPITPADNTPSEIQTADTFAFAFDIDGVST